MKTDKILKTAQGMLKLPAFFPDATYGHVIGLSSKDLRDCKIDGVIVNIFHLLRSRLIKEIERKGGIHNYMKFFKPIISDSGGFQVMSLIHDNPKLGRISRDKIIFNSDGKEIVLTPEKCIQLQIRIGTDVIMCLDDCTRPNVSKSEQEKSVDRTIRWARECKKEFERLTKKMSKKPLIFSIIQGGQDEKLRKKCAEKLLKIGFDGYSFGGWPIHNGELVEKMLKYVAKLIPDDKTKYAMGIGKPQDIVKCVKLGYNMFDCVLPTRDARHRRLYIFNRKLNQKNIFNKKIYGTISIREKYAGNNKKASKFCDCYSCRNYNIADLYRLFRAKDNLARRLATIHNLRNYSLLMSALRKK